MLHRRVFLRLVPSIWLICATVFLGCAPEETTNNDSQPDDQSGVEAYFTRPDPGTQDETIDDALIEMLAQTPSGAEVRIAYYTFGRTSVAEALIEANDRGVDVQVILGNTNNFTSGGEHVDWTAVEMLRDDLGDDRLTVCRDEQDDGGCIGENIHHNKFMLFSELDDGRENVVAQSSANITDFQLTMYNNMVVVHGDQALYDGFADYWDDLKAQELDESYDGIVEGDEISTAYFSPMSWGDPIADALDQVDCEAGAEAYVAMAFFTNYRDYIASRLSEMDEEGCDIHVMLRESEINSPGQAIVGNLQSGDIDLGVFPNEEEVQLHSKYLALSGAIGPDGEEDHVVWTGSHNYTRAALFENDEVLIEVRDEEIFEEFRDDWQFMRDRAATLHP